MAILQVKQVKSPIRRDHRQRKTLIGLGLNRIGRLSCLPATPATRGMIAKVRHLVRVTIEPLSRRRFDALGGYARDPKIPFIFEELEWYSAPDERVLGTLVRDHEDQDFGRVILARDERLRYRAIDVNSTLPDLETARKQLFERITVQSRESDESYHQGDSRGGPTDFFTPVTSNGKLHPLFKVLTQAERYTPARGIVEPMMRWYTEVDGNFIEQFQTTGFNARIWELYLFSTFVELAFVRSEDFAVPDFLLSSPLGAFGLEATTVNPPGVDLPNDEKGLMAFMENFIPIKIGRALRAKLEWRNPYWKLPQMKDLPFVLAVQDFHFAHSMQMVTSATTEYVFGVRHSLDDELKIEWIDEHAVEPIRLLFLGIVHLDRQASIPTGKTAMRACPKITRIIEALEDRVGGILRKGCCPESPLGS